MDLRVKYCVELDGIKGLPDFNRVRAETRFLLLKEFTDRFEVAEKRRLGRDYRRKIAAAIFAKQKGISLTTFFRWNRQYRMQGIEGLVPFYGGGIEHPKKRWIGRRIPIRIWMNPRKPLGCLDQLLTSIKNHPEIPPDVAFKAVAYLKREISLLCWQGGVRLGRELTQEERRVLEHYKAGTHKNHRAKALILLMASENHRMEEIVKAAGRAKGTVFRYIRTFRKVGLSFIVTRLNEAHREQVWQERKTRVLDILHAPPGNYGLNRTSWTLEGIRQVYLQLHGVGLPMGALKSIIKKSGYTWRHAKKVLTSNDPEYRVKVALFLKVLQGLKEGDAFFFIDEAGPWRVKKYGGKALMAPGVTRVIPDVQETKGAVYLICALEALTNQVTWSFIKGKTVGALLGLLEVLREKYRGCQKIYLTWDALASHNSKQVTGWIEEANSKEGPKFEVCPLPSNAQFLNVVESTFGNTRKAVIHNSDYASADEMRAAIASYLEERNAYFKANPRRAGSRIWDAEVFKVEELPGGLFRRM